VQRDHSRVQFKGNWKFRIEDQQGTMHDVMIPNTLLAPKAPYHLLSPQHWGQQSRDPEGTYCYQTQQNDTLLGRGKIIKANYPGQLQQLRIY